MLIFVGVFFDDIYFILYVLAPSVWGLHVILVCVVSLSVFIFLFK